MPFKCFEVHFMQTLIFDVDIYRNGKIGHNSVQSGTYYIADSVYEIYLMNT